MELVGALPVTAPVGQPWMAVVARSSPPWPPWPEPESSDPPEPEPEPLVSVDRPDVPEEPDPLEPDPPEPDPPVPEEPPWSSPAS